MDVEVKKMEDEIKKDFLSKKSRLIRQGVFDLDERIKTYCCELISLMPWFRLHIAKHSDQGSALQMVKYAMLTVTIKGGDSPGSNGGPDETLHGWCSHMTS